MPRLPNPERIKKLQQQAARIDRQLRRAKAIEAKQSRDADTRRKIIGGALCETHALKNHGSDFAKTYIRLVISSARPQDRWLFAEVFRALLPADDAETLLAEGEVARAASDKAKAEKRATRRAVPEAAE